MPGFELLGDAKVRAIAEELVARTTTDPMIGFFFARVDRARLVEKEYEHAAVFLGAPGVTYTGRPLGPAHARHRIFGGQFARRKEILRQILVSHGVPENLRAAWLEHTESLRAEVTGDRDGECEGGPAGTR